MRWSIRFLATAGFIGYVPWAPGTAASFLGLALGVATVRAFPSATTPAGGLFAALVLGFLAGVGVASAYARAAGLHDPPAVVIDEVWAMWAILVVFAGTDSRPLMLALAFALFRLFDTLKPPPIRHCERLPGGWGIMADDLGAAVATLLVLLVLSAVLPARP